MLQLRRLKPGIFSFSSCTYIERNGTRDNPHQHMMTAIFLCTWGQTYQIQTHLRSRQLQHCWFRSDTEVTTRVSYDAKNEPACTGSREASPDAVQMLELSRGRSYAATASLLPGSPVAFARSDADGSCLRFQLHTKHRLIWLQQVLQGLSNMVAFGDNSSRKADV